MIPYIDVEDYLRYDDYTAYSSSDVDDDDNDHQCYDDEEDDYDAGYDNDASNFRCRG